MLYVIAARELVQSVLQEEQGEVVVVGVVYLLNVQIMGM
jgi:hypothetical protein